MKHPLIATAIACSSSLFSSDEFTIDLKNPRYAKGIVTTEEGGVVKGKDLRIQARFISYITTGDQQKIIAQGDLMMQYKAKIFVGERLEFNVKDNTGWIIDARTNVTIWYMGGNQIELKKNGDLSINGAFVTTSVDRSNPWKIEAERAELTNKRNIRAQNVKLKIGEIPILWLPSIRSNLDRFDTPIINYRVRWDRDLGPRVSARWRFFANETSKGWLRLEYSAQKFTNKDKKDSYRHGPGGALEIEYKSPDKLTYFQTRNFGSYFKEFRAQDTFRSFRLQGIFKTKSEDGYSRFHTQWDRLKNDIVADFEDFNFEVNTRKETYLEMSNYFNSSFIDLTVRPKINPFMTLNQELPKGIFGIRPFEIWKTGIISENWASGSYLDFAFSDKVNPKNSDGTPKIVPLTDRKSGRIETVNSLYRPFKFGPVSATPRGGIVGIFYSDSPDRDATLQFLYTYGGETNLHIYRNFSLYKHMVKPYAHYLGYSRPKLAVDDYFVFDLSDGYDRLDQMRFGLRQELFSKKNPIFLPKFSLDIYCYSFWGAQSFHQTIPKIFTDFEWNGSSAAFLGSVGWNLEERKLDYTNIRFLWTVSAKLALSIEMRYRGDFYWRKANHENFVVDFARPLDFLLASPLSDKRSTLLFQAHLRLSPRWNLHLTTHNGWGRSGEPSYKGGKISLYTMITGNFQLSYTVTYSPNKVSGQIDYKLIW